MSGTTGAKNCPMGTSWDAIQPTAADSTRANPGTIRQSRSSFAPVVATRYFRSSRREGRCRPSTSRPEIGPAAPYYLYFVVPRKGDAHVLALPPYAGIALVRAVDVARCAQGSGRPGGRTKRFRRRQLSCHPRALSFPVYQTFLSAAPKRWIRPILVGTKPVTNAPGPNEISGGVVVSMGDRWQPAVAGGLLRERISLLR